MDRICEKNGETNMTVSDNLDKMSYDIGKLAVFMLIVDNNTTMEIINTLMDEATEEFKKNYGIEEYDNIERLILDD